MASNNHQQADLADMVHVDMEMQVEEEARVAKHAAMKNFTLLAIERLETQKEEIDEEVEEQRRLSDEKKRQLDEEAAQWRRQSKSTSPFQLVGNEFVDQDKMERKRQGRLAADAIRAAARQSILEWREGFSAKFANGIKPSIDAADGELVMNT